MIQPVVVKLGGDALASADRIVAQARRLAVWSAKGPVVAVASARRGVTDHLLGLVQEIRGSAGATPDTHSHAEADRAIAAGEVVSAALLALALEELGVRAVSLDAREAGLQGAGEFGHGRIRRVNSARIEREIARGVLPVITGFQGWRSGRVLTLGRGGTDSSAVSLAAVLGASRCVLVKDAAGLRTADPKVVPASRIIPEAPHRFLTELAEAGAKVVQAEAARLAEEHNVQLEFVTLADDTPQSVVRGRTSAAGLRGIAVQESGPDAATVTAIRSNDLDGPAPLDRARKALAGAGITVHELDTTDQGFRVVVPLKESTPAARVVHAVFVESFDAPGLEVRQAS
jgi:aspartate kinase